MNDQAKAGSAQRPKIAIVIATYELTELFPRTLDCLSACAIPSTLTRIIVAENGPRATSEALVETYKDRLPIEYRFYPKAKKCGALNRSLDELDDEFIIYFDDDVRIAPDTLTAYAEAIADKSGGVFFGGRCLVDYEEPPEAWLVPHLPAAAKGWAPAEEFCRLDRSGALGFNWGAFANDIRAAGGYDERCGPGTPGNSDEMNVQDAMLKRGAELYFLPNAKVWHYVPKSRCSPEWLMDYKRKDGYGKGIAIGDGDLATRWKQRLGCHAKILAFSLALRFLHRWLSDDSAFRLRYQRERLVGKLEGIRFALDDSSPRNPRAALADA